ncbi:MAG TPA: glycosyltransferase [Chloroflexota bacterium]|nr:glycosyltransferase [Chloroflexota bacterium]
MRPAKKGSSARGRSAGASGKAQPTHGRADRLLLSACLIVKNEEDNLARCLGSIKPAVDEIVLVDTGSTDRTVEIAASFGARIFHFTWCDDFSAARNESLRHATGEWVLWVDGDDELIEVRPGALRELCTAGDRPEWGYWANVRSPYGDTGDQEVIVRHWRIFPHNRGIQFRGRIHEEPWPPRRLTPDQISAQEAVRVDHWGYLPKGDLMQRKSERNRHLLELSLEEEPWQPLHYYNLGRQCLREGDPAAGLPLLKQGIELWFANGQPNWSFAHSLFSFASQAALDLGDLQEVLDIERRAAANQVSAELLCSAGTACWRLDRRAEAIERLNRAWQDPEVVRPHIHDISKSTWQPLLMLSGLYDQTGETEQAYDCAQRAAEFAPDHPEVLLAAGYLAGKLAHYEESTGWLRRLLDARRDEGFKQQGRRVLLDMAQQIGNPALALEALAGDVQGLEPEARVLRRAQAHADQANAQAQYDELRAGCESFPADATVRLALVDFLTEHSYEQDALNVLGGALDQPNVPAVIYRRLSLLLAKVGRFDDAANALQLFAELAGSAASAAERPAEALSVS